MKTKKRRFVTEVVCDSVQFLEPKNQNQRHGQEGNNNFQNFGGQQSGQNTSSYQNNNNNNNNTSNNNQSDNPFANANGPIDISDDDLPF